jgi:hypothetical protein
LVRFTPHGLNLQTEDGRSIHVPVTKLSTEDQQFARDVFRTMDDRPMLGFYFGYVRDLRNLLKSEELTPLGLTSPAMRNGVVVGRVVRDGPADKGGLKTLDVITHVDDVLIADPDHLTDLMMGMEIGQTCSIRLRRLTASDGKTKWASQSIVLKSITRAEQQDLERSAELALAKECPLKITGGLLKDNVIGMPELTIELENVRDSDVVAYEVEAECYNNFGDPVRSLGRGSHVFAGVGQTTIPSGEKKRSTWQMSLHDTTTKVTARVVRVKLKNGVEWNADKENVRNVAIEMKK